MFDIKAILVEVLEEIIDFEAASNKADDEGEFCWWCCGGGDDWSNDIKDWMKWLGFSDSDSFVEFCSSVGIERRPSRVQVRIILFGGRA